MDPSYFFKYLKLQSDFAFMETLHSCKQSFYIWKAMDLLEFPVGEDKVVDLTSTYS